MFMHDHPTEQGQQNGASEQVANNTIHEETDRNRESAQRQQNRVSVQVVKRQNKGLWSEKHHTTLPVLLFEGFGAIFAVKGTLVGMYSAMLPQVAVSSKLLSAKRTLQRVG